MTPKPGDSSGATTSTSFSHSKELLARLKGADGDSEHLYRGKKAAVTVAIGHNASDREAMAKLMFD
jgi:hypothetical protein